MKLPVATPARSKRTSRYQCLACGTTRDMGTRKYCSLECRQKLHHALNIRTGLLKALNTRYATFYFTTAFIVMDILPYDAQTIFSYIYPRSPQTKPASDFRRMANMLGTVWWDEKKRTNKNYLASRLVLTRASRNQKETHLVRPPEKKMAAIKHSALVALKLTKADLDEASLFTSIKKAYRLQAKRLHPDLGGDSAMFRKLHQAYEELLRWAESPTFINRRGFPDKWFYDGEKNRWAQPTPR